MDIQNGSMTSGNEVEQQTFDGANTQKWIFVYYGGGNIYTIRSAQNSSCYLGVENNSTADGANIVLRTGTITSGMKWRILQGDEGWKICAFNNSNMVLATNSSNKTPGEKLILGDWVDNDSYRDEWDFYDTVFSYVNYYDSTFTGSNSYLVNYIADANSLANLVFSSCFNVGFRMDGNAVQRNDIIADNLCSHGINSPCTSACGSDCNTQHHKNGYVISNALYNAPRENNHIYVMWTHRNFNTYCDEENGHQTVEWIAVVYNKRPVIHFMNISGITSQRRQACMTLNLIHETAHTFGMDDVYDNPGHDVNGGYRCVMEKFEEQYAYAYYEDILFNRNGATPFCASCLSAMQQLVPKKLHHGN